MDLLLAAQNLRTDLKTFVPEDPDAAVAALEIVSAVTAETERIKKKAYAVLDANDVLETGVFTYDDLVVERKAPNVTVWNVTPETIAAEEALKKAKDDLDTTRRKAGFTTEPGKAFWQMKKLIPEE